MPWHIVRFRTDAYPKHDQWMLTHAKSAKEATAQVTGYFAQRGVTIRPKATYRDQTRSVGRPGRSREKRVHHV